MSVQDHIRGLEKKVKAQAAELTSKDRTLRERSIQLDAMWWVWCSGCKGGVAHHHEGAILTEDIVLRAESNVARMRTWLENQKHRQSFINKQREELK